MFSSPRMWLVALMLVPFVVQSAKADSFVSSIVWEVPPQIGDGLSQDYCSAQSNAHAVCLEGNSRMQTGRDIKKLGLGFALAVGDHLLRKDKTLQWGFRVFAVGLSVFHVVGNLHNAALVRAAR